VSRFKSIAQSLGFGCFVILAVYGLYAMIAGPRSTAVAASGAAEALQQAGTPVIPQLINYQGYLLDGDGNTLDGTYQITFRIYGGPELGAAVWHEETHAGVRVRNGYFAVLLGDQVGKPLPADLFSSKDRYVGITVAPNPEMVPRQRFAAVAYAFSAAEAANADNLDGKDSSQFAAFNFLSATDHTPAQALVVDNDGRVGVGTTAPDSDYDFDLVDPDLDGTAILRLAGGGGGLELWASAGDSYIRGRGPRPLRFGVNATERMRLTAEGNLGIGTTSPGSRLDVYGDINSRGKFLIDGVETIIIKEVKPTARTATDLHVNSTYRCGVFDFRSYGGDIYEYAPNTSELINVDTWIDGSTNMLWADFRTHGTQEEWYVTVLCIHQDMIQ